MRPKNTRRQLAAVMFTDIVGYTALMQRDEAVAAKVRSRHRGVFEEQHKIHRGDIIQYYGDGALSVFKSAVEAIECAIAIQRLLQVGERVPLRIGLHMGDIVFDHTEVYGDGVNLASRIESLGLAGAILVSDKLNDELKNHPAIATTSLGFFDFKNVSTPIEVFAISNTGIVVPEKSDLRGRRNKDERSLAVLPFINMSADPENEYFSDGMTEEIINALAKIQQLKVTSRTSSFFFKNKELPIKQIAQELNVSAILEGSVRLSGKKVRITAQLIQAEDDYHFWSATWDRQLVNIFETQDEISLLIADKLREHFGHLEIQDQLVDPQTKSITAYEYSLKGRYYRNRWNPEDVKKAIALFEQALEIDAAHAESYLGLADCYSFLATTGFVPFKEGWERSHGYTIKARKLNPELSGVHYQLSNEAFFMECDYQKSIREMKKAIEINPSNAEAQQFMSFLYIVAGSQDKAREHLDLSIRINPLSEETQFFNAYYHYMIEDYEKSLVLLDKCLEANNKNIPAHSVRTICLLKSGRYDEVLSYFDRVPAEVIIPEEKMGVMALAYVLKNNQAKAGEYFEKVLEQCKGHNGVASEAFIFMYYAVTGAVDKAFEWVENVPKNDPSLLLLRFCDPMVSSLRSDPRYQKTKERLYMIDVAFDRVKKKKAILSKHKASQFTMRLLDHIHKDQPYLDPDLSLRALAGQLNIHPNQLSWLINEHLGKNFNDFINHYRIEAFKTLAKDPANSGITIMGLAYDSGFNSKTTFNTTFKKVMGITPKQFLKDGGY